MVAHLNYTHFRTQNTTNLVYVWPTTDRNNIIHSDRVSNCSIGLLFAKYFFFFFAVRFEEKFHFKIDKYLHWKWSASWVQNTKWSTATQYFQAVYNIQHSGMAQMEMSKFILILAACSLQPIWFFFCFASFVSSDSVFFFRRRIPKKLIFFQPNKFQISNVCRLFVRCA